MGYLNLMFNEDKIRITATGIHRNWKMRMGMRSKRFTTRWDELAVAKAG